jgi:hypothetical protein
MAKKRKVVRASAVCASCKLNTRAFALAGGILWGVTCFVLAILAMYGYGIPMINLFESLYIGFASSWKGAFIGAIWGFVDMFIGAYIFAWLYNKFC